jgi:hypothetical protein
MRGKLQPDFIGDLVGQRSDSRERLKRRAPQRMARQPSHFRNGRDFTGRVILSRAVFLDCENAAVGAHATYERLPAPYPLSA